LPCFKIGYFVVLPVHDNLRILNTALQLQTFPYPTVSKLFLYSNASMAKSGAQTLTSVTDKQTDKKLDIFGRRGGG